MVSWSLFSVYCVSFMSVTYLLHMSFYNNDQVSMMCMWSMESKRLIMLYIAVIPLINDFIPRLP